MQQVVLGSKIQKGQNPFFAVEKEYWQGTRLLPGGSWALLGCTVAPGFEFADFEIGRREDLLKLYPQYHETILELTR